MSESLAPVRKPVVGTCPDCGKTVRSRIHRDKHLDRVRVRCSDCGARASVEVETPGGDDA